MLTARHKLRWFISEQGRFAIEFRQVHRRMLELVPQRLQQLVSEYRQHQHSIARARRLALSDSRYLSYLEQLVDIGAQTHLARVQYETHLMYYTVQRGDQ